MPGCTVILLSFLCYPFWVLILLFFFLISLFLFCSVSQFSCATFSPWLWQREDPKGLNSRPAFKNNLLCHRSDTHLHSRHTNYLSLFILVIVERTLNCWPKHLTRLWSLLRGGGSLDAYFRHSSNIVGVLLGRRRCCFLETLLNFITSKMAFLFSPLCGIDGSLVGWCDEGPSCDLVRKIKRVLSFMNKWSYGK